MTSPSRLMCSFKLFLFYLCFTRTVHGSYTPYLKLSFSFDYDLPTQPVRVTVTEQCQTINITWGRRLQTGASPVAPYFLHVFASTFIVPFVIPAGSGQSFQWTVPFAPGTLYQICMFDVNGNSGSCHAAYTMIAPYNSTTPPTCQNVTFPAGAMDVVGQAWDGPLSQYGWIDQCTDIAVTPRNGTPPYTFLIAPTLHPPFRIISNTTSTMNWTVSLSWTNQFFISVTDSLGNSWANGPLHSGKGTTSACLAVDSVLPKKPFPVVAVASSLGAGFGGLLLGGILSYLVLRYRSKAEYDSYQEFVQSPSVGSPWGPTFAQNRQTPNSDLGPQYHVEPFMMPGEASSTIANYPQSSTDVPSSPGPRGDLADLQAGSSSQVYVVHHDGGPPVTLYASGQTEIVELPPGYPGPARRHTRRSSSLGDGDRTELPPASRRQPMSTPWKSSSFSKAPE